jgi:hypothetical protein
VVLEESADRFGGDGQMLGVFPRFEELGGRRECGDLAAGLGPADSIRMKPTTVSGIVCKPVSDRSLS